MQTSIFIARLIGPILLIVGAGILINPRLFRTIVDEVTRSVTAVYLAGVMDLAVGLAIVLTHNVWIASWRVIITLLGWALLLRGLARMLLTERLMKVAPGFVRHNQTLPIAGAVAGILGLVLCYFGYVA